MSIDLKVNILRDYPDDKIFDKILKLVIKSFGEENKEEFLHQLEYFKISKVKHYLLYIENDSYEIVSMIIGVQNFGCEHFLDLGWVCTDEKYRGKGLSSEIINEIGNIWTSECQTKYPYLFISNYNEMTEFYEKRGFEKIFSHHSKAVIMLKKLFN